MARDVTILMAVRNGARFLPEQLSSIAAQVDVDWRLIASDDGSTDGSLALLQGFAAEQPQKVTLVEGPQRGAVENFRHLMRQPADPGGALAFCDQDDIWHPDHLARALQRLTPKTGPALYGCRMELCDAQGLGLGLTHLPRRAGDFGNALVQNIFSGNGMVMNAPAADILRGAEAELAARGLPILLHDWWAYQLLSGCGAALMFDDRPGLRYRQHGGNLGSANAGLAALPRRAWRHLRGDYRRWHRTNVAALTALAPRLTAENRRALAAFAAALTAPLPSRLRHLRAAGVWHQRPAGGAAFWLSALLGLL